MIQQKRAILSVWDKTGIVELGAALANANYEVLSTGGTAKLLKEAKIPIVEISAYTGSPEVFGGRVKSLHPKVHGGILFDRDDPMHQQQATQQKILPIDLVCVNLYPFVKEAANKNLPLPEAIEFIDIGGPTLLRAAAKNYRHCLPIISSASYSEVIDKLSSNAEFPLTMRLAFAQQVFSELSDYNRQIANYFAANL